MRMRDDQRGFSLLEMLISLSLFLIVLATTMAVMVPSRKLYATGERTADIQQNGRLAMAEMTRQIRMAGYFPENFDDPPASPPLENAIVYATESMLAIHGDADNSGATSVHVFCIDGNQLRRRSGAIDRKRTYKCNKGTVLAENAAELRFTYYDENGAMVPDTTSTTFNLDDASLAPGFDDTTERSAVRRVVVTLVTQTTLSDRTVKEFSLNSDVQMRNVR